ncbi:GNAT family N-acetyltransferase [Bacillus carboniphilus]|uniref:GNAT family N-acetyltransferase n=1 Tax=Bacillus carboniphilus TaxID=86663 RepID=A0ABN0WAC6_9BACI
MGNCYLVRGPQVMKDFRNSFNTLAESVFGINFENWYKAGFWTDKYEPFSFVEGNRVIANVSVNRVDLTIDYEKVRGLQIGTVMTHQDYRNQGLSKQLMNLVLEAYEGQYDVMYLFANQTVLDFYPKFGFNRVEEIQFFLDDIPMKKKKANVRKLDFSNQHDIQFLYQFASKRLPVSSRFGTIHTAELIMFYALNVFSDHFYYLEEENTVVLFIQDKDQLEIYDVISPVNVNLERIMSHICSPETKRVLFYFTPDTESLLIQSIPFKGDEVLFVKTAANFTWPQHVKHPITSQA